MYELSKPVPTHRIRCRYPTIHRTGWAPRSRSRCGWPRQRWSRPMSTHPSPTISKWNHSRFPECWPESSPRARYRCWRSTGCWPRSRSVVRIGNGGPTGRTAHHDRSWPHWSASPMTRRPGRPPRRSMPPISPSATRTSRSWCPITLRHTVTGGRMSRPWRRRSRTVNSW